MHRALALAALPLLASCAAHSAASEAAAPDASGRADFAVTFIRAGPSTELPPERTREAMAGHFANMRRLAEAGRLVAAGPFGQRKAEDDLRGLFVFDTADATTAQRWAQDDPGVQAGLFRVETVPWRGDARLRELNERDAALRAELPADAGIEATIRPYCLVIAPDADAAEAALAPLRARGAVLCWGRLGGARRGQALLVLDARDRAAARALLAHCGPAAADWQLSEWRASRALVDTTR